MESREIYDMLLRSVGEHMDTKGRAAVSINGRPALIVTIDRETGEITARNAITDTTAADAAPVVHGEWIERALRPTCSLCGFSGSLIDAPISPFKYCPNCGAKMDKTGGERHD